MNGTLAHDELTLTLVALADAMASDDRDAIDYLERRVAHTHPSIVAASAGRIIDTLAGCVDHARRYDRRRATSTLGALELTLLAHTPTGGRP